MQGKGKRKHGKPQLRIDEVRRWLDKATGIADVALADPKQKNRAAGAVADMVTFLLGRLAEGKKPQDRLFGPFDRHWVRKWVQRVCAAAKVPTVCAHSMRGLHSTLAVEAGVTADVVAASVGHESASTTLQSYAKPEAVATAQQARVLQVIEGGAELQAKEQAGDLAALLEQHSPEEILAALAKRGKKAPKSGGKLQVVP